MVHNSIAYVKNLKKMLPVIPSIEGSLFQLQCRPMWLHSLGVAPKWRETDFQFAYHLIVMWARSFLPNVRLYLRNV